MFVIDVFSFAISEEELDAFVLNILIFSWSQCKLYSNLVWPLNCHVLKVHMCIMYCVTRYWNWLIIVHLKFDGEIIWLERRNTQNTAQKYFPSHGTYQTEKVSCCEKSYHRKLSAVRFSTEKYIHSLILQIAFKGEMSEENGWQQVARCPQNWIQIKLGMNVIWVLDVLKICYI